MTLGEYANANEYAVLFWAGVGKPTGETTALGHPDMDFAERNGLLDLDGFVGPDNDWEWLGDDGKNPTDDRGNSILQVRAFVDPVAWKVIVEEYENS